MTAKPFRALKTSTHIAAPTERERVDWIRQAAAGRFAGLMRGIGDDAAVLRPRAGEDIVVTTDMVLEGVHFRRDWHPAESAGHRCLARGLSDIAAMGARPMAAFLSVALPRELAGAWADGFFAGLLKLAREMKVPLAGGDLGQSQQLVTADITMLGGVPRGKALLRSSARPGDSIYVSGELGASAAGLRALEAGSRGKAAWRKAHCYPVPRVAAGIALRKLAVAQGWRIACMDISDGLSLDLRRLCEASGCGADVDAGAVPVARGVLLEPALHGGEDYELLFTAPASARVPKQLGGVAVSRIGRILRGGDVVLVQRGKRAPLSALGWEHFSRA